jgi:hypothetical protein
MCKSVTSTNLCHFRSCQDTPFDAERAFAVEWNRAAVVPKALQCLVDAEGACFADGHSYQ